MKLELSSLDTFFLAKELSIAVDARVSKISSISDGIELVLYSRDHGKLFLNIRSNLAFFASAKTRAEKMSGLVMSLRKHLTNAFIKEIKQVDFERIITVAFGNGFSLILEFFSKGNIVLVDSDLTIISCMEKVQTRNILPQKKYSFPPPRFNPLKSSFQDFMNEVITDPKNKAIKTLASNIGVGGKVATFLFQELNMDKSAETLTKSDWKKIHEHLLSLFSFKPSPCICLFGMDLTFFALSPKDAKQAFSSLSEAIEHMVQSKDVLEKDSPARRMVAKLERTLKDQKKSIETLNTRSVEFHRKGELLYENYKSISSILSSPVSEIENNPLVKSVSKDKKKVIIVLD